jgi:hypothetical protein
MRTCLWVVVGAAVFGCGNSASNKTTTNGAGGMSAAAGSDASAGSAGVMGKAGAQTAGGKSATGGAPTQGGAQAQAGSGAEPEEPLPDPDLTGLVPISAKWLLYSEGLGQELKLLDLESQKEHAPNPDALPMEYGSLSPNGAVFTFSGPDELAANNLSIIRFAKAGFVPAKPVAGFDAEPGSFSAGVYDARSRFFVTTRFGATTGVEVVDSILGERVGFVEYDLSFNQLFAPKGPYFAVYYSGGIANAGRIASVTAEAGVGEPFDLPKMSLPPSFSFSDDGKHVYFNTKADKVTTFNYVDLPDPTPHQLAIAAEGETSDVVYPGPTAASVIAWVARASNRRGLVQAFFDGRSRLDISDLAKDAGYFGTEVSADHQLVNIDYGDSFELVQLEPLLRFPLVGKTLYDGKTPDSTGMLGRYLYYLRDGILRVATIDAGALVDAAVGEAGDETNICPMGGGALTTRLAYHDAAFTKLTFVDLAARPPAVALRYAASAGATLTCPTWAADSTAFLINEKTATSRRAIVSNWSGAKPTTPVLAKESATLLAWGFSYR